MHIAKEIDRAIAAHRIRNDADLAARLNVSRGVVSNWRSGRIPATTDCIRIADALGVEPEQFVLGCEADRTRDPKTRALWKSIASKIATAKQTKPGP